MPRTQTIIRPSFPTDYQSILQRVYAINPVRYGRTRNYLDGAVSYLSPYITHGVLTLPQVRDMVLENYSVQQATDFIFQLTWREFFYRVWWQLGDDIWQDIKDPQQDIRTYEAPTAILDANTGIYALDEAVRVLYETGYMHNHARMWIASVACNVCGAYWKLPSQWLYYHLLDGDIASNTLSWQWVAGTFASKKYFANQANLNKYSGIEQHNTFLDVSYDELRSATIELPRELRLVTHLALQTPLPPPKPISIDTTKPLYLYHAWSLSPTWKANEDAERVLVLEPSHFQRYPISEKRVQFILALAKNIPNLKIFVGEYHQLPNLDKASQVVFQAHPAVNHWRGYATGPVWLFPQLPQKMYGSFFSYWKKAQRYLR
ncbi:MAG: deoxyribodipyrimidine photolyase [Phototrophicales bacterium]|nr:MAG: deoxyribodipyrimidine photolyase [Phototrophicales bacterium]